VGSSNLSWDVSEKSLKLLGIQGFEAFLFTWNMRFILGLKMCFGSGLEADLNFRISLELLYFIGYPVQLHSPSFLFRNILSFITIYELPNPLPILLSRTSPIVS
ncbi:hypothetical protein, partial [Bacillus paralicheniformis]|uniref:hypothetical protein n=1 Tax=Bacillus paralicheniformis TaxID=1648923 RepID=UPI002DC036D7